MQMHDAYKVLVEKHLETLIQENTEEFAPASVPALLSRAMRYSLLAGGKRLRPCMLLSACEMCGGEAEKALDFACAIEMIHTYSLIHDDLPGMDNDTLRRGRPTNHVVFGVGQAILAGDGLLNVAYEIMLKCCETASDDSLRFIKAARAIAEGAGIKGMIAGQCADLYAEHNNDAGADLLTYIHLGKTAAMFKGAVQAGAYIGNATETQIEHLGIFADSFGRLFQVTDDILDVTADGDFGKSKGKDAEEGKLTAVSVYGLDGAIQLSTMLKDEALQALENFDARADYFRKLTVDMYSRKH